jgi:hypothetical protein
MTRVQIPAYTDRWMRGDRYGNVVKTTRRVRLHTNGEIEEVAHVLLDESNKVVRVILADCEIIDQNLEQQTVAAYVAEGLGEEVPFDRMPSPDDIHDEDPYGMHEERRRHP